MFSNTSNSGVEFEDPGQFGGLTPNRKCTDLFGLIIVVLFFGAVIGLTVYCILNSDVDIIRNGYDNCGNICGKDNRDSKQIPSDCEAKNMEEHIYNYIIQTEMMTIRTCANICVIPISNFSRRLNFMKTKDNYCVFDKDLLPYYLILDKLCVLYLLIIAGFTGVVSILSFIRVEECSSLFIYAIIFTIFFATIPVPALTYFLKLYDVFKYCLILSLFPLMTLPSFCLLRKSSKLSIVMQLYRETNNALFSNIVLFIVFAIISSSIITGGFFSLYYGFQWILSYSYLDKIGEDPIYGPMYVYVQYPITYVTVVLLIVAMLFICEFLKNAQSMITAGCVAEWYFTRNNVTMSRSFKNLLRYHLGTVCWGSLILTVTYPLRIVPNAISGTASVSPNEFIYTCLRNCLPALKCRGFFTRNGFSITAIYGCNFCTGTNRAHTLLYENIYNARDIRILGDLILKSLIFVLWAVVMELMVLYMKDTISNTKLTLFYLAGCTIVFTIAVDCPASVLEVIMDTIFLCFCEDCLRNNGTSKPYYMSANFAEFVENANKYMNANNWNEVAEKWNTGPRRLYQ